MGNRRMGLGRLEALLEAVDRELTLTDSTLLNPTITTNAPVTMSGTNILSGHTTTSSVTKGLVSITATDVITQAEHAGRTLVLNAADAGSTAVTLTLPEATGTGNVYSFVIGVVNAMAAGYKIQVVGDDTIDGHVVFIDDDGAGNAASVKHWPTVAASDTITLTGTTTGGVSIGDWICLTDIAADQWAVTAVLNGSGTIATPFSAAVS